MSKIKRPNIAIAIIENDEYNIVDISKLDRSKENENELFSIISDAIKNGETCISLTKETSLSEMDFSAKKSFCIDLPCEVCYIFTAHEESYEEEDETNNPG